MIVELNIFPVLKEPKPTHLDSAIKSKSTEILTALDNDKNYQAVNLILGFVEDLVSPLRFLDSNEGSRAIEIKLKDFLTLILEGLSFHINNESSKQIFIYSLVEIRWDNKVKVAASIKYMPETVPVSLEFTWTTFNEVKTLPFGNYLFAIPTKRQDGEYMDYRAGYVTKNIIVVGGMMISDYNKDQLVAYMSLDTISPRLEDSLTSSGLDKIRRTI